MTAQVLLAEMVRNYIGSSKTRDLARDVMVVIGDEPIELTAIEELYVRNSFESYSGIAVQKRAHNKRALSTHTQFVMVISAFIQRKR